MKGLSRKVSSCGRPERPLSSQFRRDPLDQWTADDGSRWRGTRRNHGSHAVVQIGPAASEPRSRCACVHHGPDPRRSTEYKVAGAISLAANAGSPRCRDPNHLEPASCSKLSRAEEQQSSRPDATSMPPCSPM
jgi:hypothetical protein